MKIHPAVFRLPFFLLCLIWSVFLSGADYYFSSTIGDDSRTFAEAQNPNTPWQSTTQLNIIFRKLNSGDQIFFRRGETFRGGLDLERVGDTQIRLDAYGDGAKPIISGFSEIEEWTDIGNGIYESNAFPINGDLNMLIINEKNFAKGRYPNSDGVNAGYLNISAASGRTIAYEQLSNEIDWSGATLVLRTTHWTFERVQIESHSGDSLTYDLDTDYEPQVGFGVFIQDHIRTLDQFGEWHFNPTTQKIAVYFGEENPYASKVQVPVVGVLAVVKASNLSLENLIFEGANQSALDNYSHYIKGLSIRNCDFRFAGIDALLFQDVHDFTLENSTIMHSNNCAIKLLSCPNTTLRNNNIQHTGMQPGMGGDSDGNYTAIISEVEGFIAEYNRIINTGYVGIRFGSGDNLIKHNYIHTFCTILDDGAGIYAYGTVGDITKRKVIGNIVLNGIGANAGTHATIGTAAAGIYLDDNSQNIQVVENTVSGCSGYGIFLHNVQHFNLRRNTSFNNNVQLSFRSDHFGLPIVGSVVTDNILFAKEATQTVLEVSAKQEEIASMGIIDSNYYVRPFKSEIPILVEYGVQNSIALRQSFDLPDWRVVFGHDTNSKVSPEKFPAYSIDKLLSGNKLPHEKFDDHANDLWCFSAEDNCQLDWEPQSILDGGALRITVDSPTRMGMPCGDLKQDRQYIIRFSAVASEASSLEVYFMQANSPWDVISSTKAVRLDKERRDYEVLISAPEEETFGSIQFQFGQENATYWMDNIQLFEANVIPTPSDNVIRFEYNASKESRSIELDGNYIDAKNKAHAGTIVLVPFSSIVLIKKDGNAPNE